VSEPESSKGGRHNYSPDVGSRSVFGNYEASFSVFRSVFFFFLVLTHAFSIFDADASYAFRLPIKLRPESCFELICLGDHLSLRLRFLSFLILSSAMTKTAMTPTVWEKSTQLSGHPSVCF
jgi:hypothetical protein